MRVAIIGSGISGLAVAKRLLEKNVCSSIDIYEAAAKAGGRASSFKWQPKNYKALTCDTGQHFSIGAYTDFIQLLEKCDALKYWNRHTFEWNMLTLHGDAIERVLHFKVDELTFLRKAIFPYINFLKVPSKFFFLKFYFTILLLKTRFLNDRPFNNLLKKFYFSDDCIDLFWKPFVENSMNTESINADVNVLSLLVGECLKGMPQSIDILLPKFTYYSCAIFPIEKHLRNNGVKFFFNSPVEQIQSSKKIKSRGGLSHSYDRIVLAVPGHVAARIWKKSCLPATKESLLWQNQSYRHILNMWILLPETSSK